MVFFIAVITTQQHLPLAAKWPYAMISRNVRVVKRMFIRFMKGCPIVIEKRQREDTIITILDWLGITQHAELGMEDK